MTDKELTKSSVKAEAYTNMLRFINSASSTYVQLTSYTDRCIFFPYTPMIPNTLCSPVADNLFLRSLVDSRRAADDGSPCRRWRCTRTKPASPAIADPLKVNQKHYNL